MSTPTHLSEDQLEHLSILTRKERSVVVHYFGLGKPKLTLNEIAELLRDPDVDTNDIRSTLFNAIGKLTDAAQRQTDRPSSRGKVEDITTRVKV